MIAHYSPSDWLGLAGLGIIAAAGLWAYWREPTLPVGPLADEPDEEAQP